jgi:hypothetical protein
MASVVEPMQVPEAWFRLRWLSRVAHFLPLGDVATCDKPLHLSSGWANLRSFTAKIRTTARGLEVEAHHTALLTHALAVPVTGSQMTGLRAGRELSVASTRRDRGAPHRGAADTMIGNVATTGPVAGAQIDTDRLARSGNMAS